MYEVKQEVINWLLEDNVPPIQYLALTNLLDKDEASTEVQNTKNRIIFYQPIIDIMKNQKENSFWFDKRKDQNYKKSEISFYK